MLSPISSSFVATAILLYSSVASANLATITTGLLVPTTTAPVGSVAATAPPNNPGKAASDLGCYKGVTGMSFAFSYGFMSSDQCKFECVKQGVDVIGLSAGFDCYCGSTTPPSAAKVDDSKCNMGCSGFGAESCGGPNSTDGTIYLRVMNDMLNQGASIPAAGGSSSITSAPGSSPTQPPSASVITQSGQVITIIASSTAAPSTDGTSGNSSKPNVAGIAAGVVVGIVAIAAICGGLFLFMRQKKRQEVEEEHKRQVAASTFLAGGKPGSSGGSSFPDTRLDPAIIRDRRMSDGSIMDNQDYSRRILKVTNA